MSSCVVPSGRSLYAGMQPGLIFFQSLAVRCLLACMTQSHWMLREVETVRLSHWPLHLLRVLLIVLTPAFNCCELSIRVASAGGQLLHNREHKHDEFILVMPRNARKSSFSPSLYVATFQTLVATHVLCQPGLLLLALLRWAPGYLMICERKHCTIAAPAFNSCLSTTFPQDAGEGGTPQDHAAHPMC